VIFKVGDKVMYLGEEENILFVKPNRTYIVKEIIPYNNGCLVLEEIKQKHSYLSELFVLSSPLIEELF
jgi:hypothetical protein